MTFPNLFCVRNRKPLFGYLIWYVEESVVLIELQESTFSLLWFGKNKTWNHSLSYILLLWPRNLNCTIFLLCHIWFTFVLHLLSNEFCTIKYSNGEISESDFELVRRLKKLSKVKTPQKEKCTIKYWLVLGPYLGIMWLLFWFALLLFS